MALGEDAAGAAAATTGEKSGVVGSLAGGLCVSLLTPERYEFETAAAAKVAGREKSVLGAEDATLLINAERAIASARAAEAKVLSGAAGTAAGAPAAAAARAAAAAAAATTAAPAPAPHTLARKPQGKELAWLMRTSYVTAAGGTRAGAGRGGSGTLAEEQGDDASAPRALDREALLREIDATFAAARALDERPPAHPTRPGELRAVAVRPVLPHAKMAGQQHILLALDKDPLADCVPVAALKAQAAKRRNMNSGGGGDDANNKPPRLSPREEEYLISHALVKSYRAQDGPERFLGYMVPSEFPEGLFDDADGNDADGKNDDAEARRDGAGDPSTSSPAAASAASLRSRPYAGPEYDWIREFSFRIEKGEEEAAGAGGAAAGAAKKRNYLLDLSSPSSAASEANKRPKKVNASGLDAEPVRLVDLDTRLVAFSQKLSSAPTRPSTVRFAMRERTEEEAEKVRARRAAVLGAGSG